MFIHNATKGRHMSTDTKHTSDITTNHGFSLLQMMNDNIAKAQGTGSTYSIWMRTSVDGNAHILQHYADMEKAIADFDGLYATAAAWDQDIWLYSKATGLMMVRLAKDNAGQLRHFVNAIHSVTAPA